MSVLSGVKNLRNDINEINEDFFALGLNVDQSQDEANASGMNTSELPDLDSSKHSLTTSRNNELLHLKYRSRNNKRMTIKNIGKAVNTIEPFSYNQHNKTQRISEDYRPPTSKFGSTKGKSVFKFEDSSFKEKDTLRQETMEQTEEEPFHPMDGLMRSDNYMDDAIDRRSALKTKTSNTLLD